MTLKHWLAGWTRTMAVLTAVAVLATALGCGGDDGENGDDGTNGDDQAAAEADDSADAQGDGDSTPNDADANDGSDSSRPPQTVNVKPPQTADNTPPQGTSTDPRPDTTQTNDGPPAEMVDYAVYIPEDALVAVVAYPSRFLGSSLMKALGIDEQLDVTRATFRLDPREIERVIFASRTPPGERPEKIDGVAIASLKRPIDVTVLLEQAGLTEKAETKTHNGKEYLRVPFIEHAFPDSATPDVPNTKIDLEETEAFALGIHAIDETNYLLGTEQSLQAALDRTEAKGPLVELLGRTDLSNDLTLVLTLEGQDELVQKMKEEIDPEQLPFMLKGLAQLPDQVLHVTLSMGATGERLLYARVETREEKGAAMIQGLAGVGIGVLKTGYGQLRKQLLEQPGAGKPDEESVKVLDEIVKGLAVEREGNVASIEIPKPEGFEKVIAALGEAAQAGRRAARMSADKNTIKQIGLALHNFHDVYNQFPPPDDPKVLDADGKPKMNWRVHLLPYAAQASLYDQLNRDEPWDSKRNKPILTAAMPFYKSADDAVTTKTRFRMFSGEGTIQPPKGAVRLRDITDGASNTLMAIQVGPKKAVEWYKPGTGIPIDSKDLIAELGEPTPKGWLFLYCDGRAGYLRPDIEAETLKALVTIAGGEVVEAEAYEAR